MRLWHEELIPILPRAQLLGQHRECCALRGNGWGKKHSTVDYVFRHNPNKLFLYHSLIMKEMTLRGYRIDKKWLDPKYRGKKSTPYLTLEIPSTLPHPIYSKHDKSYLQECIENLKQKNIFL